MYTSDHQYASQIIVDSSIQLPRFQRKKSWDEKTRFKLCISLFKEYPMGTIVLKKETKDRKTVKWLLDGRQRRDTFVDMQNPENIYDWARSFLKFKLSDNDTQIEKLFNEALKEYLYYDENESDELKDTDETDDVEKDGYFDIETGESIETAVDDDNNGDDELESRDSSDLADLLYIILSVHKKTKRGSNFTDPFNFDVEGFKPSFITKEGGKTRVDSTKLTEWILSKNFQNVDTLSPEQIIDSFDNCPPGVQKEIKNKINNIIRSIKCVNILHERLMTARVSIILLDDNCSQSDSQKIFEIINTHGQKLTNAEILSAKPIWNTVVPDPALSIVSAVHDLYEGLGTSRQDDVVVWDVAATLTSRLPAESDFIFGDVRKVTFRSETKDESVRVDDKINYGFKLYAARYLKSISKNVIDNLASSKIDWNSIEFEDEIKNISTFLIKNDPAIGCFSSYRYSFRDLLSDAVVMCYVVLLIEKYKEITSGKDGEPKGNSKKEFIVKSRVLLDRLVYEYCCGMWKGSSDSRLKSDLKNAEQMFSPIEPREWEELIISAYEENKIRNAPISKNVLEVLVYYFSMIRNKTLHCIGAEGAQIDHIIPNSSFTTTSSNPEFKDSLYNYALLTATLNKKKSSNIKSIERGYKDEICKLEDIDESIIVKLTEPGAVELLKQARKPIVEETIRRRNEFVKGEGYWSINT